MQTSHYKQKIDQLFPDRNQVSCFLKEKMKLPKLNKGNFGVINMFIALIVMIIEWEVHVLKPIKLHN